MLHVELTPAHTPKRLYVTVETARDYRRASSITGATPRAQRGNSGSLTFPLDPLVIVDLRAEFGTENVRLSAHCAAWMAGLLQNSREVVILSRQDNVRTDAPWDDVLFPYQRTGSEWLRRVRRGILGDEMGLGKTIQALTAARGARRLLIVTVPIAKRVVWEREIRTWDTEWEDCTYVADLRTLRVQVVRAAAKADRCALIVNHEMLRDRKHYADLWTTQWDCIIIDEAHKLQGRASHSQQSRGAELLQSDRLYLLTGTPVWNRPESVWHLLHLIDPKRWSSYWRFVDEYCAVEITPWARKIIGINPATVERLQSVLSTVVLQRKKREVLPQLPEKTVVEWEYDLTPAQRKAYKLLKKEFRIVTQDGVTVETESSISKTFADLRRLCNAPTLIGLDHASPKDDIVSGLVEQTLGEGKQIVVFTWHKDYAAHLHRMLREYKPILITGEMENRERDDQIRRFQQGYTRTLIATIATMGVAINLTAANVAIFAEGSYVPTMNAQAEDRLHRIGQRDNVLIYRLSARNSVESALWSLVADRSDTADEMLSFRAVVERLLDQPDE